MRVDCINICKIDELSDEAKQRAHSDFLSRDHYFCNEENKAVLEWFENHFQVDVKDWEYGYRNYINWYSNYPEEQDELSGIRLISFLWNNHRADVYSSKYYSLWSKKDQNPHYREGGSAPWGKLKSRRSKVFKELNCPTGYVVGYDILQPIQDVLNGKKLGTNYSLYDCMNDCLEGWLESCKGDYEHSQSMEYFIEHSQANEYEYTEDGEFY